MRRTRENPDTGAWLVAGGVAIGIVGLVWFMTRSSSTSASTATSQAPTPAPGPFNNYGPPYVAPTPTVPRADYQIVASNTSVALKVGQVLAIAQPHPAGPNQNWGILIQPPAQGGQVVFQDAAVTDLGWQSDYTDHVKPTAPGGSTVVMNLYDDTHGQAVESYSIAITASA